MVRLKVKSLSNSFLKFSSFQFLMVRLKGGNMENIKKIKEDISIPYGAIKSPTGIDRSIPLWKFQFLMVRLKVIH